ncbi:hypothetical protein ACS0ZG_25495 [Burkholderia gladioli]
MQSIPPSTVASQKLNALIRFAYLGFVDDPDYPGLGARFQLVYLEGSDLS